MKRLLLLLPLFLGANEDFISHYEYGEMLYNNPRGVSCSQCHGHNGEGEVIVQYQDEEGKKVIRGSDIRRESLSTMTSSLTVIIRSCLSTILPMKKSKPFMTISKKRMKSIFPNFKRVTAVNKL